MYTLEELIRKLKEGVRDGNFGSVQEAVRHAVAGAPLVAEAGSAQILHNEPGLMVLHAVVGGGYASLPHDHRTWAVIGVYQGQEDNTFFRRVPNASSIEQAGGRSLKERDVLMLGPQGIHKIANPRSETLIALHVYGLNVFEIERSAWDPVTGEERPFAVKIGDSQKHTKTP
jgi:predicted metal-dependent enzyme (double-stranded beta helix superfamily)